MIAAVARSELTPLDVVQLGVGIATLFVASLALYLTITWNRKKAAIDKLEAYDYYDSTAFLEGRVKFYTRNEPMSYSEVEKEIDNDSDFLNHMFRLLQYHSALVRGAETATYKKRIVGDNRSHSITRTYYFFHKYIDQRRTDLQVPSYFQQIERFALKNALESEEIHNDIKQWARDRIAEPPSIAAKEVAAERQGGRLSRWSSKLC